MSETKEDFAPEDVLTALYKLAHEAASKVLRIDLMELEKLSSPLKVDELIAVARLGCTSKEDIAFVEACESVLVKEEA